MISNWHLGKRLREWPLIAGLPLLMIVVPVVMTACICVAALLPRRLSDAIMQWALDMLD